MKHTMDDRDPWNQTEATVVAGNNFERQFEDDFVVPYKTDRLPDSAEYLASLEKKLAKLKRVKGDKKNDGKDLVKSLEESSESCMYRLIAGDAYSLTEEDLRLETPTSLSAQWLKSQVRPEQALTAGELVRLVTADYLAQEAAEHTTDTAIMSEPSQFWGVRTFCLVTGASQGIGRSFSVEFARRFAPGSRLVLLARSMEGLRQTQSMVLAANPDVIVQVHTVDLSEPEPAVYQDILQHDDYRLERYELALLVHNAGSVGRVDVGAAHMDDPQEWHRYMSLNLYHVTPLTCEFLRRFTTGRRCIVNVTSLCAVKPFNCMGFYCVGKAAREMYFKVLASENPDVNVLSYSPGPIETDMVSNLLKSIPNSDTKKNFETLRESKTFVTLEQTTQKVIDVLAAGRYVSGDRFDYFDPL